MTKPSGLQFYLTFENLLFLSLFNYFVKVRESSNKYKVVQRIYIIDTHSCILLVANQSKKTTKWQRATDVGIHLSAGTIRSPWKCLATDNRLGTPPGMRRRCGPPADTAGAVVRVLVVYASVLIVHALLYWGRRFLRERDRRWVLTHGQGPHDTWP